MATRKSKARAGTDAPPRSASRAGAPFGRMTAGRARASRRLTILTSLLALLLATGGAAWWLGFFHRPLRFDEAYDDGTLRMLVVVHRLRGFQAPDALAEVSLSPLAAYWMPETTLYHPDGTRQLYGWCRPIRVQSGDFPRDKPPGDLMREGLWTGWHSGGRDRSLEVYYAGGKEGGPCRTWHKNGRLQSAGVYRDGKRSGLWTTWHDNGQKDWEGAYVAGQLHGDWTTWHPNGQLRARPRYDRGRQVGDEVIYDEQGQVTIRKHWLGGKEHGLREVFHSDRRIEQHVKDDQLDGEHREYNQAGRLLVQGQYAADKMEGRWVSYFPSGELESERHYQDGQLDGRERVWHADGTLLSDGSYRSGQRHGPWTEWDGQGSKLSEGGYRDGLRDGEWTFYEAGQPMRRITYRNGAIENAKSEVSNLKSEIPSQTPASPLRTRP